MYSCSFDQKTQNAKTLTLYKYLQNNSFVELLRKETKTLKTKKLTIQLQINSLSTRKQYLLVDKLLNICLHFKKLILKPIALLGQHSTVFL